MPSVFCGALAEQLNTIYNWGYISKVALQDYMCYSKAGLQLVGHNLQPDQTCCYHSYHLLHFRYTNIGYGWVSLNVLYGRECRTVVSILYVAMCETFVIYLWLYLSSEPMNVCFSEFSK